jgi:hypothetical protein
LRAINYFDSKGFINTPSAVANGDGDMRITNSCDGRNGSDFVTPDNFKINVVGGKSEIIISSIYIGSTESATEITNADISVRENFDITLPLYLHY